MGGKALRHRSDSPVGFACAMRSFPDSETAREAAANIDTDTRQKRVGRREMGVRDVVLVDGTPHMGREGSLHVKVSSQPFLFT